MSLCDMRDAAQRSTEETDRSQWKSEVNDWTCPQRVQIRTECQQRPKRFLLLAMAERDPNTPCSMVEYLHKTQKEEGKQSQRIGIDWDGIGRVDKGTARRCGHLGGGYRVGMTSVARRDQTRKRSDGRTPMVPSDALILYHVHFDGEAEGITTIMHQLTPYDDDAPYAFCVSRPPGLSVWRSARREGGRMLLILAGGKCRASIAICDPLSCPVLSSHMRDHAC